MNIKISFIKAISVFLLSILAISSVKSESFREPSPTISIVGTEINNDNNKNIKTFIVESTTDGFVFCDFWLLSARFADGRYSKFDVLVNDDFIGCIKTEKDGWQSSQIENNPRIKIQKGINKISIATDDREFPDVEKINFSTNYLMSKIDDEKYCNYIEKAETQGNATTEDLLPCEQFSNMTYANDVFLINDSIKLKYSFFKIYNLKKSDVINISASSVNKSHSVDVLYIGDMVYHTGNDEIPKYIYTPASSDECQGLTWKRNSQTKNGLITQHFSDLTIDIPKTGLYMIKMRTTANNALTVANVSIKAMILSSGTYRAKDLGSFEKVPIYYSGTNCIIPRNINYYALMTNGISQDNYDPMLFVEGNAGHRIVGFNDDADNKYIKKYGLCNKDAYIQQVYKVKTSNIHIVNYTSSNPESKCNVICRVIDNLPITPAYQTIKDRQTQICHNTKYADNYGFEIYNESGKLQYSTKENFYTTKLDLQSGLYIIKTFYQDGSFNVFKKVIK